MCSVRYLYGIILSLLAVFFLFMSSGEREQKKATSAKTNSYIEGLRIVQKKDGADSLTITADRADFTENETVARMHAVTIFAPREGITVQADAGTYHLTTKELLLKDAVTVRMKDSVISAEDLSWDPSFSTLTSGGRVVVSGKKFRIEGEGLSATQDQQVRLMKDVKATFF